MAFKVCYTCLEKREYYRRANYKKLHDAPCVIYEDYIRTGEINRGDKCKVIVEIESELERMARGKNG